MKNIIAELTL